MAKTEAYSLAELYMADDDTFRRDKHAALTQMLAEDIQDAIDGFFEFPDLTLKHLREREEREKAGAL